MDEYSTVEEYLGTLHKALKLGDDQKNEIVEEVRGDLSDHRDRLTAEGLSNAQATREALKELGNPYELAAKMQDVVIPKSARIVNVLRYVVVGLIALALLPAVFYVRSWEQIGFTPRLYLAVCGLFGPILLLAWPGIVWRWNRMFFIYPAALILLVAVLLIGGAGGASATTTIELSELSSAATVAPEMVGEGSTGSLNLIAVTCAALVVGALAMMQRKRQRIATLAAMLLYCAVIEIPIQIEENVFKGQARKMKQYVSDYHAQHNQYPGEGTIALEKKALLGKTAFRLIHGEGNGDFSLSRGRLANRGFALTYYSDDDRFVSTD